MEFDVKRIYTAINADEVKVGSEVKVFNTLEELKKGLDFSDCELISEILPENNERRFAITGNGFAYAFCYLVSEPKEKKVKWAFLKNG